MRAQQLSAHSGAHHDAIRLKPKRHLRRGSVTSILTFPSESDNSAEQCRTEAPPWCTLRRCCGHHLRDMCGLTPTCRLENTEQASDINTIEYRTVYVWDGTSLARPFALPNRHCNESERLHMPPRPAGHRGQQNREPTLTQIQYVEKLKLWYADQPRLGATACTRCNRHKARDVLHRRMQSSSCLSSLRRCWLCRTLRLQRAQRCRRAGTVAQRGRLDPHTSVGMTSSCPLHDARPDQIEVPSARALCLHQRR